MSNPFMKSMKSMKPKANFEPEPEPEPKPKSHFARRGGYEAYEEAPQTKARVAQRAVLPDNGASKPRLLHEMSGKEFELHRKANALALTKMRKERGDKYPTHRQSSKLSPCNWEDNYEPGDYAEDIDLVLIASLGLEDVEPASASVPDQRDERDEFGIAKSEPNSAHRRAPSEELRELKDQFVILSYMIGESDLEMIDPSKYADVRYAASKLIAALKTTLRKTTLRK